MKYLKYNLMFLTFLQSQECTSLESISKEYGTCRFKLPLPIAAKIYHLNNDPKQRNIIFWNSILSFKLTFVSYNLSKIRSPNFNCIMQRNTNKQRLLEGLSISVKHSFGLFVPETVYSTDGGLLLIQYGQQAG